MWHPEPAGSSRSKADARPRSSPARTPTTEFQPKLARHRCLWNIKSMFGDQRIERCQVFTQLPARLKIKPHEQARIRIDRAGIGAHETQELQSIRPRVVIQVKFGKLRRDTSASQYPTRVGCRIKILAIQNDVDVGKARSKSSGRLNETIPRTWASCRSTISN